MARRLALAFALLTLAFAAPVQAASLDPTFGADGRLILSFGELNAIATDIALEPDGRVVAAGWLGGTFGAVRLLPDGQFDPGFGTGGVTTTDFGTLTPARSPVAVALQPDGKVVLTGSGPNSGATAFSVMRLNADGTPDTGFGAAGKVVTPIGPGTSIAHDVAVQPDGRIVVAGNSSFLSGTDFAAVRYLPDGRPDPGFGDGGQVVVPMVPDSGLDSASSVTLLPDGRITLAGVTARPETGFDFAAVRLLPDGTPDPSFGGDGRIELPLGTGGWIELVTASLAYPDGSLLVGGAALQPGFGPSQVALARFTGAGLPDPGFASGGGLLWALGTLEDTSRGLVDAGGTTYVGVDSKSLAQEGGSPYPRQTRQVGVLALDAAGRPDASFAPGGLLLFGMRAAGDDHVAGVVQRSDGALLVLSTTRAPDALYDDFGLAVVLPRDTTPVTPPPVTPPEQPAAPQSVITWPKRGARLRRLKRLRGTAGGNVPRPGRDRAGPAAGRRARGEEAAAAVPLPEGPRPVVVVPPSARRGLQRPALARGHRHRRLGLRAEAAPAAGPLRPLQPRERRRPHRAAGSARRSESRRLPRRQVTADSGDGASSSIDSAIASASASASGSVRASA